MNLKSSYAWGYDLSGTEQGAGGVGGLLFVKQSQTTANNSQPSPTTLLAPSYDGNGNITTYINVQTGQVACRHEYDAFGNELSLDAGLVSASLGSGASLPSFKFSTKYTDAETGLCYYGYRYYSPETGRWVNRDPIEERGGANLYMCCDNRLLSLWDRLGLQVPWTGTMGTPAGISAGIGLAAARKLACQCAGTAATGVATGVAVAEFERLWTDALCAEQTEERKCWVILKTATGYPFYPHYMCTLECNDGSTFEVACGETKEGDEVPFPERPPGDGTDSSDLP